MLRHRAWLALVALACGCPSGSPTPNGGPSQPVLPAPPPGEARVVVVGGGLTGLVAAYELEKQGIATHVLEASDAFGGRVGTAHYGDDVFAEYGMQEIWLSNPLVAIARELGVPLDDKPGEPLSSLILDGQLFPYTQTSAPAFLATFLSRAERKSLDAWMRRAAELRRGIDMNTPLSPELTAIQDQSFAAWVYSLKLPRKVEEWIRLTVECELATDWDSFSGVIGLYELGSFLGKGEPCFHVRGGNSKLIEALQASLHGKKELSSTVTGVSRRTGPDGKLHVTVSYLQAGHLKTIEAERAILAVPFVRLHQIVFEPPLSEEKWQAVLTLGRGQYTVVHLLMDKGARKLWEIGSRSPFPVLSDGSLGVIYGVMHPSPPAQPEEVFSLLVFGAAANSFHMVPRETKLKELMRSLDRWWPGLSKHVHASYVYTYHPAAIPVWPPGRSPFDERGRKLREPELGIYFAGDYTLSAHATGAAESAVAAAKRVAAELKSK